MFCWCRLNNGGGYIVCCGRSKPRAKRIHRRWDQLACPCLQTCWSWPLVIFPVHPLHIVKEAPFYFQLFLGILSQLNICWQFPLQLLLLVTAEFLIQQCCSLCHTRTFVATTRDVGCVLQFFCIWHSGARWQAHICVRYFICYFQVCTLYATANLFSGW